MEPDHIFVAEDDLIVAELLSFQLNDAGYRVTCASDGLNVVVRWRTLRPALLVLDIGLPSLDGFGVLAGLARLQETDQGGGRGRAGHRSERAWLG